ncbi:MAG: peptide deformylase [Patescibacteria group bacterium]|nr:peptide deformylase [Patescibacteria group bacterium]MCL5432205.1 peptide deformylase [Patescibacteria group bacterium]
MYSIVKAPSEILRTPVGPADLPAAKLAKIIAEMKATLIAQKDPEGVGLSANQVGLPYLLFLARFDTKPNSPIHVFINPEIVSHSEELQEENEDKSPLEGCLSLPKYYGFVKRWKTVELRYQDENCKLKTENFRGFPAVVIQHEMDHLEGKIFVERILEQSGKLYKVAGKNKKGKDTWEEVEI